MLGLYALPEKFTKEFKFENTWSMFFAIATFIIPVIVSITLINQYGGVLSSLPSDVVIKNPICLIGMIGILTGIKHGIFKLKTRLDPSDEK